MRFSLLRLSKELGKYVDRRSYVIEKICGELNTATKRRLFAVIYIHGKQFKVSQDDIIHLEHNFPADVGDRIKFDKVLMVGGENFSVIGRPLLSPICARVYGTVIEKNYTQPDVEYNPIKQDANNVIWYSHELTVLRVNDISLSEDVFTAKTPLNNE